MTSVVTPVGPLSVAHEAVIPHPPARRVTVEAALREYIREARKNGESDSAIRRSVMRKLDRVLA